MYMHLHISRPCICKVCSDHRTELRCRISSAPTCLTPSRLGLEIRVWSFLGGLQGLGCRGWEILQAFALRCGVKHWVLDAWPKPCAHEFLYFVDDSCLFLGACLCFSNAWGCSKSSMKPGSGSYPITRTCKQGVLFVKRPSRHVSRH